MIFQEHTTNNQQPTNERLQTTILNSAKSRNKQEQFSILFYSFNARAEADWLTDWMSEWGLSKMIWMEEKAISNQRSLEGFINKPASFDANEFGLVGWFKLARSHALSKT